MEKIKYIIKKIFRQRNSDYSKTVFEGVKSDE